MVSFKTFYRRPKQVEVHRIEWYQDTANRPLPYLGVTVVFENYMQRLAFAEQYLGDFEIGDDYSFFKTNGKDAIDIKSTVNRDSIMKTNENGLELPSKVMKAYFNDNIVSETKQAIYEASPQ